MKHHMSSILFFLLFVFLSYPVTSIENDNQRSSIIQSINGNVIQTYIVHLAKPNDKEFLGDDELERWHKSFLPNTTLDSGEPRLVYSYSELMTGFAARLTSDEVQAIQHMDGFLHAEPDMQDEPETTYTPNFLGLSDPVNGIWKTQSNMGEGLIIGVIDTGIPSHHPSFGDNQMPAKPMKWKGICNFTNFSCNNKIIGGATFEGGKKTTPPVDIDGHGSHVASIAAGNFVKDAMVVGKFNYTASGMAPRAHLAIYKVTVNRSDSLKAFEQAISDGVDVINFSKGSDPKNNFYLDTAAFSGYKALEKNICISVSAGNRGQPESLSHSAPWLTVVGASWPDRRLAAAVRLGNGSEFIGETGFYQPTQFNSSIFLPIVYPGANNKTPTLGCLNGSLSGINVKDKIVLCWSGKDNVNKGDVVLAAGGAAMILMGPLQNTRNDRHVLPVSHVSQGDAQKIIDYYNKSPGGSTPTATIIFKGQESGRRPAPAIAGFSSRGPSLTNGGILKPDVIAPGYEILGASPVQGHPYNNYFKYESGTSMAAPHVAGVMALIKKKYPTWSPAAIQSAIITSADDVDLAGRRFTDMKTWKPADIFARGAGHLNPTKAMDPGLVFDRNIGDYIGYMCGLGYNAATMQLIADHPVNCSTVNKIKASQLNYPSIMVTLKSTSPNETVVRTVTNVGNANSMYTPRIVHPANASVILSINRLQFSAQQPQMSFDVTISIVPPTPKKGTITEGKLEWVSSNHIVRSPIAVVFG